MRCNAMYAETLERRGELHRAYEHLKAAVTNATGRVRRQLPVGASAARSTNALHGRQGPVDRLPHVHKQTPVAGTTNYLESPGRQAPEI
jgi:hypothetical protein